MRLDLLRAIKDENEITNAVVLTHNIDFVFLQTVVVSALKKCGHPTLTVLADAECAASAYSYQAPLLHGLGVRYRVVPVEMAHGFRFHPKAVLLSGTAYATLSVGSGNLTFGGWRENAEIWVRYDSRADGTGPFTAFRSYLSSVLERVVLAEPVRAEIEEAFDPATRAWAADVSQPTGLIGRANGEPPLLTQMFAALGDVPINGLTVCAPYFDTEAEALRELVRRAAPAPVRVLVQAGRTGLTEGGWARVGPGTRLSGVGFHREDDGGRARTAFIHAKFYAFEQRGRVTVFLGSANCSRAALTVPGTAGNAELLAVQVLDADKYGALVGELVHESDTPPLAEDVEEATPTSTPTLRILGASYERANLRVAYAPRDWRISECLLDGAGALFEQPESGLVVARVDSPPRQVRLVGSHGDTRGESSPGWIDNEWELRSTARSRSVAEGFRSRVRAEEWGIGAWTEVLDIFCGHLRYLPARITTSTAGPVVRGGGERKPFVYSAKDVFAVGYGLPRLSSFLPKLSAFQEGRVRSLQQLLLRWFRLPTLEDDQELDDEAGTTANDDDVVDRPEQFPRRARKARVAEPTDRDRRRVERLVARLCEAMTSPAFLAERPPELLAADIRVASILLRVALSERWLDPVPFFKATHRVWSTLFFESEGEEAHLERRHRTATSPDEMAAALGSPDLLAALAAWVLAVPAGAPTAEHARLSLGAALAIARLPWLWDAADDRDVCRELADLLANTTPDAEQTQESIDIIGDRWLQLLQRGHAMRRLEAALVDQTPAELSSRVTQTHLTIGELLWQGKAGFCVVTKPAARAAGGRVRGLRLQGPRDESDFAAHLTVPLAALLGEQVVPLSDEFGAAPRGVLRGFLAELGAGFGRTEESDSRPTTRRRQAR